MSVISKKNVEDICKDLGFGFLDAVLATIQSDKIPDELLTMGEVKEAAVNGIRYHLLDSRGDGDVDTAIRIRDLFGITNKDVEEDAKQGIENWTTDKGREFGEKIRKSFGIPQEFMESKGVMEAERRFLNLNRPEQRR